MPHSNEQIRITIEMPREALCGDICRTRSFEWGVMMAAVQDGDHMVYRTLLASIATWLNDTFLANQMVCQREIVLKSVLHAVHDKRHTFVPGSDFGEWLRAIALYRILGPREFKTNAVLRVTLSPLPPQ